MTDELNWIRKRIEGRATHVVPSAEGRTAPRETLKRISDAMFPPFAPEDAPMSDVEATARRLVPLLAEMLDSTHRLLIEQLPPDCTCEANDCGIPALLAEVRAAGYHWEPWWA